MSLSPNQTKALTDHIKSGEPAWSFVPPPSTRRPRNNEESVMQRALIKWWTANCRHFGVPEILLFSVPNGGNGSAKRGSIMKAEGQRKGVPDLMLAAPRLKMTFQAIEEGPYKGREGVKSSILIFGLFLELKTASGRLSPEQEVYHEILARQGYRVCVCRSLAECIDQITAYLT